MVGLSNWVVDLDFISKMAYQNSVGENQKFNIDINRVFDYS